MEKKDEVLNFLRQNKQYFRDNYRVTKLGLFGSFARGTNTEDSDIDLIIELEEDTKDIYDLKNNLRQFVRENLGRNVDLTREKYLKPYAKEKILKEVIYV
ncbi:hypothetical protein A3H03_01940 [Candidatus Kuenenbacteria bacterium RIFCSPLOWO2_12_FULL_42_13]|uniref:Polymerase nucleotidyl transferase domain-containing protein n=4 Tax=Candidatus Kueneniibacteriota TaxID=1752740 RepID=A0A0G1BR88_9BACT|nr:MAG: hypothetical protein UV02_C0050G0003 [Candidatus Kuenenbacteria bacterium GW2011_GWA2_42_15]OGG90715.1 MAG: hypothetical protein A3H55_00835 [Candidatus Kuenenbacteria bacterium RIFCSPLOWO2_02_FULL_42_16]OGG91735.1 MAG: hypothetical protein A3H03_01940 [Candidatus Kuenenbacteria bacterium RIFCSPLOWO2_12_FULL_42_13]OGG95666.1 MAG: hypothetical protein A2V95_00195 [Candidatus Kuenenbacteria bacterium RBG_16_41_7]